MTPGTLKHRQQKNIHLSAVPKGFFFMSLHTYGYANEVGESFRPLVHTFWVRLSYGVAFGYVLADTAHKASSASNREKAKDVYDGKQVALAAADTLLWQTLASIAIPGLTINRLCALSLYMLKKSRKLSPAAAKWTTTGIGLACIPFIVTPIDRGVDYVLDSTVRRWFLFPQHSAQSQSLHKTAV